MLHALEVRCGGCGAAGATVWREAEGRALCEACDTAGGTGTAISLVALPGGKGGAEGGGAPPCDICQEAAGRFFCRNDRALLCSACDLGVHSKGMAKGHIRFFVPGVAILVPEGAAGGATAKGKGKAKQQSTSRAAFASDVHDRGMPPPSTSATVGYAARVAAGGAGASRAAAGTPAAGGLAAQPATARNAGGASGSISGISGITGLGGMGSASGGGASGMASAARQPSLPDPGMLDELLGLDGLAENGYSMGDVVMAKHGGDLGDNLYEGLGGFDEGDLLVPTFNPNQSEQLGARGYSGFGFASGARDHASDDAMVPDMGAAGGSRPKRQREGLGLAAALSRGSQRPRY